MIRLYHHLTISLRIGYAVHNLIFFCKSRRVILFTKRKESLLSDQSLQVLSFLMTKSSHGIVQYLLLGFHRYESVYLYWFTPIFGQVPFVYPTRNFALYLNHKTMSYDVYVFLSSDWNIHSIVCSLHTPAYRYADGTISSSNY